MNIFKKQSKFEKSFKILLEEKFKNEFSVLSNILTKSIGASKSIILNYYNENLSEEEKNNIIMKISTNYYDFINYLKIENELFFNLVKWEKLTNNDWLDDFVKYAFANRKKWIPLSEDDFEVLFINFYLEKVKKISHEDYMDNLDLQKEIKNKYKKNKALYWLLENLLTFEIKNVNSSIDYISILDSNNKHFVYIRDVKNFDILQNIALQTLKKCQK